jgi:hypothetical protein
MYANKKEKSMLYLTGDLQKLHLDLLVIHRFLMDVYSVDK